MKIAGSVMYGIATTVMVCLISIPVHAEEKTRAELQAEVQALQQRVQQLEAQQPQIDPSGSMMWDPFAEMERMQQEMNRMFNDSFGRGVLTNPSFMNSAMFDPEVDIRETDKQYVVTMDIPGMDKSAIEVKLKNHQLHVSGERVEEVNTSGPNNEIISKERSFGRFSRVIGLPSDVKDGSAEAEYEDGVLRVVVDKVADSSNKAQAVIVQ